RKALGEGLAFRVGKGCDAGARDGVDAAGQRNSAGKRGLDDVVFDRCITRSATFQSIAIALDQPRAFDDFERVHVSFWRRRDDERKPCLDGALLLLVAKAVRPEAPQSSEGKQAQKPGN